MKMRSSSSFANRLSKAAWYLMIVAGASILAGCDTSGFTPGQVTTDGIQQIQTFFQDFARELFAAFLL